MLAAQLWIFTEISYSGFEKYFFNANFFTKDLENAIDFFVHAATVIHRTDTGERELFYLVFRINSARFREIGNSFLATFFLKIVEFRS